MMTHQLEQIAARGVEPVALLWASEAAIYGRFGYGETTAKWHLLRGNPAACTFARTSTSGRVGRRGGPGRLPAGGQALRAAWLPDRPGALERTDDWWRYGCTTRTVAAGRHGVPVRAALRPSTARPDGYLSSGSRSARGARSSPSMPADRAAYAALWRFVARPGPGPRASRCAMRRSTSRCGILVADPRAIGAELGDGTYARTGRCAGAALEARRYAAEVDATDRRRGRAAAPNSRTFRLAGRSRRSRGQRVPTPTGPES